MNYVGFLDHFFLCKAFLPFILHKWKRWRTFNTMKKVVFMLGFLDFYSATIFIVVFF